MKVPHKPGRRDGRWRHWQRSSQLQRADLHSWIFGYVGKILNHIFELEKRDIFYILPSVQALIQQIQYHSWIEYLFSPSYLQQKLTFHILHILQPSPMPCRVITDFDWFKELTTDFIINITLKSFSQRILSSQVKTWPVTITPHSEQVGAIFWNIPL